MSGFINWITQNAAVALAGGGVGLFKYLDQRQRELQEQRFEQYWRLIDTCEESPRLGKQKIALLLLKRYPEYKTETVEYLSAAKRRNDPWTQQNISTIEHLLKLLGQ
jgi:hypothetical protein